MKVTFVVCLILCLGFLILAAVFAVWKGKAAILISGFNTIPKAERQKYDTDKMSKDQRNIFLLWAGIQGIGAVLSYFVWNGAAVAALVIWLVVFFKDVHLDEEKAFGKYKK